MRYLGDRLVIERPTPGSAMIWVASAALFLDSGFVGLRIGHRYLKLRDLRRHPLLFSERNLRGYQPLLRIGEHWELGLK